MADGDDKVDDEYDGVKRCGPHCTDIWRLFVVMLRVVDGGCVDIVRIELDNCNEVSKARRAVILMLPQ